MLRRLALAATLALAAPAAAQEQPNLMIVFDGSGSMWGQINGEAKIALARRALSQVLSEASPAMRIGMLAYGHRVRGQCSDIETMVPMGAAMDTVPQIIAAANGMNPRGMTPISDAVMIAAEGMGFTEQSATIVLVTDGIETCGGDPCALGRALAAQGVDFRAHVVGFDLSDEEQRQVSCLADETGGLFLAANDAGTLAAALATTLSAAPQPLPAPPPPPVVSPREVQLVLRDVAGGEVLTGRPFPMMEFHPADEALAPVQPRLGLNPGPITGTVALVPGDWQLVASRQTNAGRPIPISLPVTIPEGTGPYILDLVLAARLQLTPLLAQGQPLPAGSGRLPTMAGQGWAEFAIHPIVNGAIDPAINYRNYGNAQDVALPPGDYFVRGTLSGMLTRERLVHVPQGETTTVDFDFRAVPVTFDMRDAAGVPTDRREVRIFDIGATDHFISGYTRDANGLLPVYLPPGIWRATFGTQPAAEIVFATTEPGVPMTIRVGPGDTPDPALAGRATPNCAAIHRGQGCVAEAVTPADVAAFQGSAEPLPRFTGTWASEEGMMLLVQEGRRVWGEVYINGGIGRVWGHVAPDGLTLRGAMDRGGNPRGAVEMRLSNDGGRIFAVWDHSIARMGTTLSARRLSGAVPPLTVATGTEADLRVTMAGQPWAPADSAEFAAFMAPALAPADPNTGEDIDAMQAAAPPVGFTGVWATNNQMVTLVQDGRIVRGMRDLGPLVGEVSADGRTLRGIWDNGGPAGGGQWGLFEFRLDEGRTGFEGRWGMAGDTELRGGAWTGTRRGFLADVGPVIIHPALTDATLSPWFAPVRDTGPAPALPVGAPPAIDPPAPDGGAGFGGFSAPATPAATATLPPGIYAEWIADLGTSGADIFARLNGDPALQPQLRDACTARPVVIHPDGLMAGRERNPMNGTYATRQHARCEPTGEGVSCTATQGPPGAGGAVMGSAQGRLVTGPDDAFLINFGGSISAFRNCLSAMPLLSTTELAADGRPLVSAIAAREDGGPAFALGQPAPALAPLPVAPTAASGAGPLSVPAALAGFVPMIRFDYAHADGRPAVSFVFDAPEPGGPYSMIFRGWAYLHEGWCGTGCPAGILPVGGATDAEVQNAQDRLDGGGVFPALDLSTLGILAFEADGSTWPNVPLRVHVLDAPFDPHDQLGPNRANVVQSFGPFAGGTVPPSMDGWPLATAAAPPVPDPIPNTMVDPGPAPVIGTIDVLPQDGIYAMLPARMAESVDAAFARLFDGSADVTLAEACALRPVVVHPDGLIAERTHDAAQAQVGGPAFRTDRYQVCAQSGPLAFCSYHERPLTAAPGTPDFEYRAEVVAGPSGSFGLRDLDLGSMVMYRECRGDPGRFLDPMTRLPDGRLLVDEMLRREDRDAAQAPVPAPIPGSLDFAALQGAYGQANDLDWGCRFHPGYLHADGELVSWGENWTGGAPQARLACRPDGACSVISADPGRAAIPADIRLQAAGGTIRLCADGSCDVTLARCDAVLTPAEIALMARRDGAEAAMPATGLDFAALSGLWTRASADLPEYACRDGGLYIHPDGTAVAWENPGPGPEHVLTLSCEPGGACAVTATGTAQPPFPPFALSQQGPGRLALCENGDCAAMPLMSCAGAVLPPSLLARMSSIPR